MSKRQSFVKIDYSLPSSDVFELISSEVFKGVGMTHHISAPIKLHRYFVFTRLLPVLLSVMAISAIDVIVSIVTSPRVSQCHPIQTNIKSSSYSSQPVQFSNQSDLQKSCKNLDHYYGDVLLDENAIPVINNQWIIDRDENDPPLISA